MTNDVAQHHKEGTVLISSWQSCDFDQISQWYFVVLYDYRWELSKNENDWKS